MYFLVLALLFGGIALILWGFVKFARAIFSSPTSRDSASNNKGITQDIDGMNEGDYYNGPHGYSPMTGYPETQYGSGFDEDAEWHEEH